MSEADRERLALERRAAKRDIIRAGVLFGTVPLAGAVVVLWPQETCHEHVGIAIALVWYVVTVLGFGLLFGGRGAKQLLSAAKAERALDEARLPVAKLLR